MVSTTVRARTCVAGARGLGRRPPPQVRAQLRRLGTIGDVTARDFWTKAFGDGTRYVAWTDFWPRYLLSLGVSLECIATAQLPPTPLSHANVTVVVASSPIAALLHALAVFLCDERARVWQRRFGLIVDTFAPTCGIDVLTELTVLAARSWFCGVRGRARAARALVDGERTIRLSPVVPALFFLTLRSGGGGGRIRHVPIHRLGRNSFLFRGQHYSSIGQCLATATAKAPPPPPPSSSAENPFLPV